MTQNNNLSIVRTDNETNEKTIISIEEAIKKLENYWQKENIIELLSKGQTLFTPYATYTITQ